MVRARRPSGRIGAAANRQGIRYTLQGREDPSGFIWQRHKHRVARGDGAASLHHAQNSASEWWPDSVTDDDLSLEARSESVDQHARRP